MGTRRQNIHQVHYLEGDILSTVAYSTGNHARVGRPVAILLGGRRRVPLPSSENCDTMGAGELPKSLGPRRPNLPEKRGSGPKNEISRKTPMPNSTMHLPPRTVVHWCVYLLIAAATVETWFVAGLGVPCRVTGGSMAKTLLGVHRNATCGDCGHRFPCGTDQPLTRSWAVCPNCGFVANDLTTLPNVEGDRLLIDRSAFSVRSPRRWEIVALRRPRRSNEIAVKRVVGLPGESIEIRGGDVYIDGNIQRKSLAEQHALSILVHNADEQPRLEPTPPPRWRGQSRQSRWSSIEGGFTHPVGPENEPVDWLTYHHGLRPAGKGGKVRPSPVTDILGYDLSRPRREEDVCAVADLMLSFRLTDRSGRGDFLLRATDGGIQFKIQMQFEGEKPRYLQYQVYRGGQPVPGGSGNKIVAADEQLVEVSLIDQQLLLALGGRTVVARPYRRPEPPPSPVSSPLAIGVRGLGVTVRHLRVYRDVYYTRPAEWRIRPGGGQSVHLASDEYYVLGDNSPISADSRNWPDGGTIGHKSFVGKPLVAIPTLQVSPAGRWRFQVPNPAGIRYIR